MESKEDVFAPSSRSGEGSQPVAIIAQFMQSVSSMKHVDELFLWIAETIVRKMGVGVVQIWANQAYVAGGEHAELRATASQHSSVPPYVYVNSSVVGVIGHILHEKRNVKPLSVANFLPAPLANAMVQYQMQYWTSIFLGKNELLLPPMRDERSSEKKATPFEVVVVLFTQQPPQENILRPINFILQQVLRIAATRNFFAAEPQNGTVPVAGSAQFTKYSHLVPRRTQDATLQQEMNPFANAVIITEKKSRRFYSLVDGKKSIADLSLLARLEMQETVDAVNYLLQQQYILLYTADGKPIEDVQSL
jgi:hypothetical protein